MGERDLVREKVLVGMYCEGRPVSEILETVEINPPTLYRALDRHNVKKRRPKFTQHQRDKAALLYQEGRPISEIQEELGMSTGTLYKILHQNGIELRRR